MKNRLLSLAALAGCILLSGCGLDKKQAAVTYEHISQEEAKQIMDSGEDYVLLDVRTQAEFDEVHIPGAICIPNETISDTEPEELPDKEQQILVYCRSGNRSRQAADKLAKMGYTNIKEFGGINTWSYETE